MTDAVYLFSLFFSFIVFYKFYIHCPYKNADDVSQYRGTTRYSVQRVGLLHVYNKGWRVQLFVGANKSGTCHRCEPLWPKGLCRNTPTLGHAGWHDSRGRHPTTWEYWAWVPLIRIGPIHYIYWVSDGWSTVTPSRNCVTPRQNGQRSIPGKPL